MKKVLITALFTLIATQTFAGAYENRVWQRISPNIATQETATSPVSLEIKTINNGEIVSTTLTKPSDNPAFDRAVIDAVNRTQVLPRDIDGNIKNIKLTVNSDRQLIDSEAILNEQTIKEQQQINARTAAWAKEAKRLANLPGVRIGQSADYVTNNSSWGKPKKINSTVYSNNRSEQWVYGNGDYLYFTNGQLTSIQTSK